MPRTSQTMRRSMRFCLIDEITELEIGRSITATKRLHPDEEYLRDHFPRFPVMPGVLMLEAMFQASAWLVRATDGFEHPFVLLKEVRSVKYASFLAPEQVLTVSGEISKQDDTTTNLKVQGTVEGVTAVSGRLVLERFKLSDRYPNNRMIDPHARNCLKEELGRLLKYETQSINP